MHILQNGTVRKIAACKARLWPGDKENDIESEPEVDLVSESSDVEGLSTKEIRTLTLNDEDEVVEVPDETEETIDAENVDKANTDDLINEDIHPEVRPKRGSIVRYRIKDGKMET